MRVVHYPAFCVFGFRPCLVKVPKANRVFFPLRQVDTTSRGQHTSNFLLQISPRTLQTSPQISARGMICFEQPHKGHIMDCAKQVMWERTPQMGSCHETKPFQGSLGHALGKGTRRTEISGHLWGFRQDAATSSGQWLGVPLFGGCPSLSSSAKPGQRPSSSFRRGCCPLRKCSPFRQLGKTSWVLGGFRGSVPSSPCFRGTPAFAQLLHNLFAT